MDRFQEMRTFMAVVDAGSFVGATEGLGLSKAAISRQVSDLEARLATRLLHRTTRRLALTDEGQAFLQRCRQILAALDEAEAEVSLRRGEAAGLLRVNAPLTFGIGQLAPLWGMFRERHPKVDLEIHLNDRVVDLIEEGYDLAVRIGRLADSALVVRQLGRARLVLCASPRYLATHGAPATPQDLAAHAVIAYTGLSYGDDWPFTGPDGRALSVRTRPCIRTNNGDTCRIAALAHQGIVLQPDFLVGDDLKAGTLVEVLPQYRSADSGIHAVYPTRRLVPLKVRLMVDFLVEAFREPRWAS